MTHAEIIDTRLGGTTKLAETSGWGLHRVRHWKSRNSIPPAYWSDLVRLGEGAVTLEMLASATAGARRAA